MNAWSAPSALGARKCALPGGSSRTPSLRRGCADAARWAALHGKLHFRLSCDALILRHRTTLRGSETCVNLLSPLHFCPSRPSRAACRTRCRAVRQALSPVRPWLTSPTATLRPAPSSVVWLARPAAPCRASATDLTNAAARSGAQAITSSGPSGQTARVVLCFCADRPASRPGREGRGERCSTRS